MRSKIVAIADQVRAIASTGLHFNDIEYDRERYERLLRLAAELTTLTALDDDRLDAEAIEALYRSADHGYVTPKLDARMAIFRADRVLLIKEGVDRCWALPGGYIDVGDSPSEAAVRETAEEAGLETRARRLAGVFDLRLQPDCPPQIFHIHKYLFTGEALDANAEPRAGSEAIDVGFFSLDDLPRLSRGRTLPLHIREAYRVHRDPEALPYFD
ncbi:MAG: NUDIX domain-containing protein [bacterium]|nr:NUDIX domain-containing protein [bacterium]